VYEPGEKACRKGENRQLTIFKGPNSAQLSDVHALDISDASLRLLQQHMNDYPPTEQELAAAQLGNETGKLPADDANGQSNRRAGDSF
jgi:hypothetical protein